LVPVTNLDTHSSNISLNFILITLAWIVWSKRFLSVGLFDPTDYYVLWVPIIFGTNKTWSELCDYEIGRRELDEHSPIQYFLFSLIISINIDRLNIAIFKNNLSFSHSLWSFVQIVFFHGASFEKKIRQHCTRILGQNMGNRVPKILHDYVRSIRAVRNRVVPKLLYP